MENEKILKMNEANNSIVIDDGMERVPMINKLGQEIGAFYLRPTDINIINRFNESVQEFEKVVEPLENIDLNPDGTSDSEIGLKVIEECKIRLYELCDKIFGLKMSEDFFASVHPFSIIGGKLYCENALNALGQYISRKNNSEVKRFSSRISKYVQGYVPHGQKTGKHKNGKKPSHKR